MKKQILTIVGARPQFIKASVVSRQLAANDRLYETILHTGQHYDKNMSELFFQELGIPPPALNLHVGSMSHGRQTARMLEGIEDMIFRTSPAFVLVYGDTNSTLAGALAAVKLHVPVAHVEAGLRSFNLTMPEEVNRLLTDRCASLLFAPTDTAVKNLLAEGHARGGIHLVGDVMFDASLLFAEVADKRSRIILDLGLQPRKYVVASVHRAENTDDVARLEVILRALAEIHRVLPVIVPLHPRTRSILAAHPRLSQDVSQLRIMDPVSYLDMVQLQKNAAVIVTDSGGMQKEAYFYRVPCVTVRGETEWIELVENGWNVLAPPATQSPGEIAQTVVSRIGVLGNECALYGTGHAAEAIIEILASQ